MRDLDLAERLIAAAVEAVDVPVTVKMRLGWDDAVATPRSWPRRAESGRRRGRDRPRPHPLPVLQGRRRLGGRSRREGGGLHPGDRQRRHRRWGDGRDALHSSGADGVMIGRGATAGPGSPPRSRPGSSAPPFQAPEGEARVDIVSDHFESSLRLLRRAPGPADLPQAPGRLRRGRALAGQR